MKHGSLFSGIGGFDLAAEWMGWENVFHCEWNEFGRKVLNNYWPKSISYEDITKVDFRHHRGGIDILTGGFPCQPYSNAGKRLGTDDDRNLWPEMLRSIREIQPSYVVGENVRGLTNWNGGLVFDEVQADLESECYEVLPFLLPACAINAPHRRDRIWFVAYSNKCNDQRRTREDDGAKKKERVQERNEVRQSIKSGKVFGHVAYSDDKLRQMWDERTEERRENEGKRAKPLGDDKQGRVPSNWQNFPTQPPICGGNDGLPAKLDGITFSKWRNESIKAYGNAIVPQVAFEIFKAIYSTSPGKK